MSSDVIIVGAGIAGLTCAYDCVEAGLSVKIIYQGDLEQTSSYYAQGGIAAAWSPNDSPLQHMTDTIMAGDGLCDSKVVQDFCNDAPSFVKKLIDIGVPFDTEINGDYRLTQEGAHSQSRIFHVKDYTGTAIIMTLVKKLKVHRKIKWVNQSIGGVLTCQLSGRVIGVRVGNDDLLASQVVFATGGFSNIFSRSTNPKKNIGEGLALAYMLGARLGDLEFIQFHPTVYCASGHPPLLISEALRGEGAFLVNKNNDRFMKKYHELEDLAPRDVVARAIIQEQETKLNIAPLMTTIKERFPTIFQALQLRGFTVDSFEIPVQPLVHYTLGGIVASPDGKTNCSGLYAIGECAVTGFHGANRLASNSLLEAGIMGQRCAKTILNTKPENVGDHGVSSILIDPLDEVALKWLGDLSNNALGVIRSDAIILSGIQAIQLHEYGSHPLFQLVLAILQSAYHRKESRGGHFRSDYKDQLDHSRHSMIQKGHEVLHIDSFLN